MERINRVLRHNIKANLFNGIASAVAVNLITPFLGIMAGRMGASNTDFALLSSIPALLSILATLPISYWIERFEHRKRAAGAVLIVSRLCFLLMVFVPWLPVSPLTALIWLVGIYTATNSVCSVAYQAIIGEIIPASYRNRIFSARNMWSTAIGILVTLLAGWSIDYGGYPVGYQMSFLFGFVVSIAETWFFFRFRVPSENAAAFKDDSEPSNVHAGGAKESFVRGFLASLRTGTGRSFWLFAASSVVFVFAWQAVWPVYVKVKVDELHASNFWISIDTVLGAVGSIFGFRVWSRFADRRGNGLTVFVTAFGLALTPLQWLYAPSMAIASLYSLTGGFVTAGYNQSLFNRLLELVPVQTRQRSIALYTTLAQGSAIVAPIVGMKVYESLPYSTAFIVFTGVRVMGAICFLFVVAERSFKIGRSRGRSV